MKQFKEYTSGQRQLIPLFADNLFVDGAKLRADGNKYGAVCSKNTARWKVAAQKRAAQIILEADGINRGESGMEDVRKDIPDGNDADDLRNGPDCAGIREKATGQ